MLTLLAHILLKDLRDGNASDYPDHLKEHADRYIRSPRAHKHQERYRATRYRDLW
ncbi:hypothetical protein [Litoreibacter roseus]|uniref:Uncharacterized protein n=1 Tax=Litoreibacter roseus TaxID=2601869 RepID=A0A6N6JEK4_9RHOB|nr:hypothetical protein [Litoreibacter roseus]GFE64781.1 hypothetical protein KIN_18550 [Litoreibacter roseus]